MATSGQLNTGGYGGRYFEFNWWLSNINDSNNTATLNWNLIARAGSVTWYYTKNVRISINGNQVFNAGSGKTKSYKDSVFASGSMGISGGSGLSVEIHGDIYVYGTDNAAASASWTVDNFTPPAVDPTPFTSVSASGGNNNWLDKDNPIFNASWSGATNGTYKITMHNIDASKDNWASIITPYSNPVDGATSGSASNISLAGLGLSGGETVRIRAALLSTQGSWLLTNWGGSFHIYSRPSAPTTFNVPSSQEIDTSFNISWSGAKAGSEGINKYQVERRVYNGSSWGGWTRVVDKNVSSYTAGTPKSITGSNSDACQIQFRVRTFDGHYGYSDWVTKTVQVKINSPTTPRKQKCFHK